MRSFLILCLSCVSLLALPGCGGKKEAATPGNTKSEAAAKMDGNMTNMNPANANKSNMKDNMGSMKP